MADSSLDDYIKTNHITRSGKGSGGRGGRGGRGGFQRRQNGARFSGGSGGITKNITARKTPAFLSRNSGGGNQDRWQHDLFGGGSGAGNVSRATDNSRGTAGAKLLISNLEYGVSDNDIRELFSEFGPLRKSALHYDQSGRSIGTAEVIFAQTRDAVSALNKYNGIPLDGRAMSIQLIGGTEEGVRSLGNPRNRLGESSARGWSSSGPRFSGGRGRGGGRAFRGGGARTGFQKREKKPEVTQEQLDMELEEYQSHPV